MVSGLTRDFIGLDWLWFKTMPHCGVESFIKITFSLNSEKLKSAESLVSENIELDDLPLIGNC